MIRLAHLSDIHLETRNECWTTADWLSKRFTTWVNLRLLLRGRSFCETERVLVSLTRDLRERKVQHVIFSGDATALGFRSECLRAAESLCVEEFQGLAVPGNHDYCTPRAAASGDFEAAFARWQAGNRIDHHIYPFAQRVGDVWLIGVNSAVGNRIPWDARGEIGERQLSRLAQLLEILSPGPRILVTHYPICRSDERPEPRYHGLRDLASLIEVAQRGGIRLWLHGHRHSPYILQCSKAARFPAICAGSATHRGLWSFHEYEIDGTMLVARRRHYQSSSNTFCEGESVQIPLA